jgi:hypothetical protein
VINSGREVTLAMRTTPIQVLPRPVFPARMSPYRDSFAPEKTISAVHAAYIAQYRKNATSMPDAVISPRSYNRNRRSAKFSARRKDGIFVWGRFGDRSIGRTPGMRRRIPPGGQRNRVALPDGGGMTLRPRWFALFAALPLVLLSAGVWAAKPGPEATPAAKGEPAKPAGAPVVLDGKTLFVLREKVMSFTPEDRAGAILRRLKLFLKDPLARPEMITVIEGETSSEIVAGEVVLMTVTDRDAAAEGKPRAELAKEYAEILRASVRGHIEAYADHGIVLESSMGSRDSRSHRVSCFLRRVHGLYSPPTRKAASAPSSSVGRAGQEECPCVRQGSLQWIRLATALLFYFYVLVLVSSPGRRASPQS